MGLSLPPMCSLPPEMSKPIVTPRSTGRYLLDTQLVSYALSSFNSFLALRIALMEKTPFFIDAREEWTLYHRYIWFL